MGSQRKVSALQRSEVFEALSPGEMARLLGIVEQLDLPKHHQIFGPGSPNTSLYFIEHGSVRVTRPSPDGKSFVILSLFGPGELLGNIDWVEDTHDCSAETLEESRIFQMSRRDFEQLVRENPSFALSLIQILGTRLKQAQSRIEDLVFRQVPSRVAKLFLNLADNHGKMTPAGIILDLPLTHQEIADIVGSSRVTVTQVLNRFRSMNWVAIKSKRVTINDIAALEDLIASDANPRKRNRDFASVDGENGATYLHDYDDAVEEVAVQ
jgi:CRP/FNR family transcriptional regulator, cyclic AMP receptor protein